MTVYLGADHRGFSLKEYLKAWLLSKDISVEDCGDLTINPSDDYVDFARKVGESVVGQKGRQDVRGIVICGSGVGVEIAANKVDGVRCGLGFSEEEVRSARLDDNINVLALPADFVAEEQAMKLSDIFLTTPFSGDERHQRRLNKISDMEEEQ